MELLHALYEFFKGNGAYKNLTRLKNRCVRLTRTIFTSTFCQPAGICVWAAPAFPFQPGFAGLVSPVIPRAIFLVQTPVRPFAK